MYFTIVNVSTGQVSLGALGDSFYEYLLKSWIGTSEKDVEAKDMYFKTVRVRSCKCLHSQKGWWSLCLAVQTKTGSLES